MDVTEGELGRDGKGAKLQAPTGFSCQDGTPSTPKEFPLAISDNNVITLIPPANAVALIVKPVGEDLLIGCEDATLASLYDTVLDGGNEPYPCAGLAAVYVKRAAATAMTLRGHWQLVGA